MRSTYAFLSSGHSTWSFTCARVPLASSYAAGCGLRFIISAIFQVTKVKSSNDRDIYSLCNKFFEYAARDDEDPEYYDRDHIGHGV